MSILNARARTATRYARAAAALLPSPPSDEERGVRDGSDHEWELLVLETALNIAAAVRYDHEALRLSLGPAIEVGIDPPWRILLELALRMSGGVPPQAVPRRRRKARLASPATRDAMPATGTDAPGPY